MKKTLLAATLFTLYGSSIAGTFSATKQTHSLEGINGVTSTQTSNPISYTIAENYIVGDKVILTFPTGALAPAFSFPSPLNISAVDNAVEGNAIAGLTLTLSSFDTSSATYEVTAIAQPDDTVGAGGALWTGASTNGASINFGSLTYTATGILTTPVTITVSSEHSAGTAFDTSGTRTGTVAETKTQFGTGVLTTLFDNNILQSSNLLFSPNSTDTMTWSVLNPTTAGWLNLAIVNSTQVVLSGEAGNMTGLTTGDFSTTAGTPALDAALATLTTAYAGGAATDTVTFTAPGTVAIQPQGFTLSAVYNYTSAAAVSDTKTLATGLAAGRWSALIPLIIPDAPTIGTATAGNSAATVTFNAPTNIGGSAITGYTVTSNPVGGTDSNSGSTSLSHKITGLSNGTAYTFTVTATNAQGTSSASAVSNSITPVASSSGPSTTTESASSDSSSVILKVISQNFTQVSINEKETNTSTGIQFPLGVVSFNVTSSMGGTVEVDVNFPQNLPSDGFFLYKVDTSGNTTLIPNSLWKQQGSNGIRLTITDGGPFDLDGVANGVIVDPIAVGTAISDELEAFTFSSVTNAPVDQWTNSTLATIKGLSQETEISINGGFISIDGGDYTAGPATVGLGQTIRALVKSSTNAEQSTTATIQVGDYSTSFTVTTANSSLNELFQYGNSCSQSSVTAVLKAYIAHYNRPADVGGLNFWSCEIDKLDGSLDSILTNFANTPEFTEQYGGLSDSEIIDKFYQQLFKRDPDAEGKSFWLNALVSGSTSYEHIAMALINGTVGKDTTTINNKLLIAEYFLEQLGKNGINTADFLNVLGNVNESIDSVIAAKAIIDSFVAGPLNLENSL